MFGGGIDMNIKLKTLFDYARRELYDENIIANYKDIINVFEDGIEDLIKQTEKLGGQLSLSNLLLRLKVIEELAKRKCESEEPVKCDSSDSCRVCSAAEWVNHIEQVVIEAEKDLGV